MGRATTKPDLIGAANEQFEKLWKLIGSMTEEQRHAPLRFGENFSQKEAHWKRDKNLRDVLVHLYEWHQLLLHWVAANQNGEAKPFLPEPYNWKTYGQMNVALWEKHQSTPYGEAEAMLRASHDHVMKRVESLTDEELFESGRLPWTGNSTLGAYCVSATSSHYEWAMKKIKAYLKACRESA